MRLRNIPGSQEVIDNSPYTIKESIMKEKKGHWSEVFGNDKPLYLEIGMGKGRFISDLAVAHPENNYIGIERYSSVLLRGIQKREQLEESGQKLDNLLYICADATELPEVFAAGEVAGIYLNFSDPWPKDRHARRRLPSRQFLARYEQVLAKGGKVEFKTDNDGLFAFALEEAKEAGWTMEAFTWDLHHDEVLNQGNIMTEYEEKFSAKGNDIHKMIISKG